MKLPTGLPLIQDSALIRGRRKFEQEFRAYLIRRCKEDKGMVVILEGSCNLSKEAYRLEAGTFDALEFSAVRTLPK